MVAGGLCGAQACMGGQKRLRGSGRVLGVTPVALSPPPQDDTMRETVQQQLGASVPTDFGTFPSSSFLKVRPSLLGALRLPGTPAQGRGRWGTSALPRSGLSLAAGGAEPPGPP